MALSGKKVLNSSELGRQHLVRRNDERRAVQLLATEAAVKFFWPVTPSTLAALPAYPSHSALIAAGWSPWFER